MVSHSSSCKLVVLVILALQINLFATAFDGGDDVNIVLKSPHQAPSDQDMEEEPLSCHRLRMSIPRHLHPEALKSGRCAGIDNQGGIWSCPQDRQPKRSDFHFGLHCEDMELLFSLYSADEMAGLPQDIFGFDYQSWCKCPNNNNNVIDNNTNGNAHNSNNNLGCDLCTNGMILNQNVQDSIFNGETAADKRFQLTCAEAAEYARYITNEERCEDALDQARAFCCEIPPESSTTTHPPPSQDNMTSYDVQLTIGLMLTVVGLSTFLVHGSLRALEFIDDYWFSWEDM